MRRFALLATAAWLALPAAAGAQSIDLPPRRAGQWEIKVDTQKPAGTPPMSMQACLDAATDKELMEFGLKMGKDMCSRYDARREGGRIVIDAECKIGPVSTKTKTIISGDFQSVYTVQIDGVTDTGGAIPGMPKGPQPTAATQTGRFVSPTCNGLKPGDIQMAGLPRMNIRQLKQLMPMLGGR